MSEKLTVQLRRVEGALARENNPGAMLKLSRLWIKLLARVRRERGK